MGDGPKGHSHVDVGRVYRHNVDWISIWAPVFEDFVSP